MADMCYICEESRDASDQNVSYDDCYECGRPTCKQHGRQVTDDRFYCVRDIEKY